MRRGTVRIHDRNGQEVFVWDFDGDCEVTKGRTAWQRERRDRWENETRKTWEGRALIYASLVLLIGFLALWGLVDIVEGFLK